MPTDNQQIDFLSWMTGIVVLVFLGGAVFALVTKQIDFTIFAASVGPPASALIGFWVRGKAA